MERYSRWFVDEGSCVEVGLLSRRRNLIASSMLPRWSPQLSAGALQRQLAGLEVMFVDLEGLDLRFQSR